MSGLPYELPAFLPGDAEAAGPTSSDTGGDGAGSLRVLTDHCDAAHARILAQYKESPLLLAFLCSFLDRAQTIDLAIVSVAESLDIDTAEGVQLDLLGRIVGEARDGRADYVYRRGIKVRVLVNRSQGRIPDLIAILRLFEDMDGEVGSYARIGEVQPARIEVRVDRTFVNEPAEIRKRLRRAKAAGVSLQTIVFPQEHLARTRTEAFRLKRPADAGERSDFGLAAVSAPVTGGYLAHVLA